MFKCLRDLRLDAESLGEKVAVYQITIFFTEAFHVQTSPQPLHLFTASFGSAKTRATVASPHSHGMGHGLFTRKSDMKSKSKK